MRPASLDKLRAHGVEFVHSNGGLRTTSDTPLHYVSRTRPARNFDGSARQNIVDVILHERPHPSAVHLSTPLFRRRDYREIVADDGVDRHPLINVGDCSPALLVHLGLGLLEGRLPMDPDFRSAMIQRIGAIFLAEATPRHLMADLDGSMDFVCKDNQRTEINMVASETFFESLSRRRILGFDVHDLAQHALQLKLLPDQFVTIARAGRNAFATDAGTADGRYKRLLMHTVWGAALEEAVVQEGTELYSFGCVNWLRPTDTPAARVPLLDSLDDDELRLSFRWHYLDALKDLYRKQHQAARELCLTLSWMERLGYDGNRCFTALCASNEPRPFARLALAGAARLEVSAPRRPVELLDNAIALLAEEGLLEPDDEVGDDRDGNCRMSVGAPCSSVRHRASS